MTLSITDPAFLFPGISLLFLAYTNRYLALAKIVRELNQMIGLDNEFDANRRGQIDNLKLRINIIKYMQMAGVLAFVFCVFTMMGLFFNAQHIGFYCFGLSLVFMLLSLLLALLEIMFSGTTLKLELERTHQQYSSSTQTDLTQTKVVKAGKLADDQPATE